MNNAEMVVPPRTKSSVRNLQQFAVTASSVAKQVDPEMQNRYVTLKAVGADVTFCFGPDNTVVVDNTLTGDRGTGTQLGYTLTNGQDKDFLLGGADEFIAVQGSTTGTLLMLGSGPKRIKGGASEGP